MVYFHGTTDFYIEGPTAVTLGKFDGIHRGHQKLMRRILELEKADPAIKSTAFVFNSNKNDKLMTAAEQKSLIAEMGISNLVNCPFVPEITGMLPEEFVREVLIGKLHASHVVVGTDFRFGKGAKGDCETLKQLGERFGIKVDVIRQLRHKGVVHIGNDEPQELGTLADHRTGYRIGGVIHLLADLQDAGPGPFADLGASGQGARDGGIGDTGNFCDVFNGDIFHGFLSWKKMFS